MSLGRAKQLHEDFQALKMLHRQRLTAEFQRQCESCADSITEKISFQQGVAFHRGDWPAHCTASLCLLSPSGDHLLLTHHKKLGKWLQLGGHIDEDETPQDAALREGEEESGLPRESFELLLKETGALLDVDVHTIPPSAKEPEHEHLDLRYLARAFGTTALPPLTMSDESHALKWVPLRDLKRHTTEESLLRLGRKISSLQQLGSLP